MTEMLSIEDLATPGGDAPVQLTKQQREMAAVMQVERRKYDFAPFDDHPELVQHTTLISSGESVVLPALDEETTLGILVDVSKGDEPKFQIIPNFGIEVSAILPNSVNPKMTDNILNMLTVQLDDQSNTIKEAGSMYLTDGSRAPNQTRTGLARNPELIGSFATQDGTLETGPLTFEQLQVREDDWLKRSVLTGPKEGFLPDQFRAVSNDPDMPLLEPSKPLSILRPINRPGIAPSPLILGLLATGNGELVVHHFTPETFQSVANDDLEVPLVGWLEVGIGSIKLHGRNSLRGRTGGHLPALMVKTLVELPDPTPPDPALVAIMKRQFAVAAGWSLDEVDSKKASNQLTSSTAVQQSSDGEPGAAEAITENVTDHRVANAGLPGMPRSNSFPVAGRSTWSKIRNK